MNSNIQSTKPNRMKNHVEDIKPLWRRINLEVPPYLQHSSLHSYVLPWRYTCQYLLQAGDITHRNLNREWLPIQDITKRWHVMIWNQHWNAPSVERLDNSGTCNFITTWTKAKLASPHHFIVRYPFWELLMHLDIVILIFPVLKNYRSDRTMKPSCKES